MLLCLVQIFHLLQCFIDLQKCCFRGQFLCSVEACIVAHAEFFFFERSTCRVAVICFPCITVASVSTRKDVYAYIDLTVGPNTHET